MNLQRFTQTIDAPLGLSRYARYWLAGPLTLLVSILMMATSSLCLPRGKAGVDNLVYAMVLFPVIWAVIFMYVVLESDLKRAAGILFGLFFANALLVGLSISGAFS